MISNPLVSIVIPTYNRYEESQNAIASAIAQTYRPIEIIIVEDASNSGIEKWASHISHDDKCEIAYFRNSENKGLSATKNVGIRESTGKYVSILDDDDEWKPEKLSKQMMIVHSFVGTESAQLGVVSSAVEIRYRDSLGVDITTCGNRGLLREDIIASGIKTPSSTFLFPRQVLLDCGGYDESLKSSTDHDMIMNLADRGYYGEGTNEPLTISYARIGRSTNMTNTNQRIESVYQYLDKWNDTYEDWLGVNGAVLYKKKYFAYVISMLLKNKIFTKNYKDAWRCFRKIIGYSGFSYEVLNIIFMPVIKMSVKMLLPEKMFLFIKRSVRGIF